MSHKTALLIVLIAVIAGILAGCTEDISHAQAIGVQTNRNVMQDVVNGCYDTISKETHNTVVIVIADRAKNQARFEHNAEANGVSCQLFKDWKYFDSLYNEGKIKIK